MVTIFFIVTVLACIIVGGLGFNNKVKSLQYAAIIGLAMDIVYGISNFSSLFC